MPARSYRAGPGVVHPSSFLHRFGSSLPPTMRLLLRVPLLTLLTLSAVSPAFSQLVVSPPRVLLANRETARELTLRNEGTKALEIDVRTVFAMMGTDSTGLIRFDSIVTDENAKRSCIAWTKVFPRHFTLTPGAFQRVRVVVTPPPGLADGEYVARLYVSSACVGLPAIGPAEPGATAITTVLSTRLVQNFSVIYRRGKVSTDLEVDSIYVTQVDSTSIPFLDAHSLGNAAYRGTLNATVDAEGGSRVDSIGAVFVAETPVRLRLLRRRLAPGSYRLSVNITSTLPGSASESVLSAPSIARSYRLTVAASGTLSVERSD